MLKREQWQCVLQEDWSRYAAMYCNARVLLLLAVAAVTLVGVGSRMPASDGVVDACGSGLLSIKRFGQ
jgi:hypothetical protein